MVEGLGVSDSGLNRSVEPQKTGGPHGLRSTKGGARRECIGDN